MNKDYYAFVKSHNLVNRIYDMFVYFKLIKNTFHEPIFKKFIKQRIVDVEYVETLAKYFEDKLKKNKKNIDLRCNLNDLIYDLEYLKQYLS